MENLANHNAHPHISNQVVSVVHNGIIENYLELKDSQIKQGYKFTSDTDTEVIAHAIDFAMQSNNSFLHSVQKAIKTFEWCLWPWNYFTSVSKYNYCHSKRLSSHYRNWKIW